MDVWLSLDIWNLCHVPYLWRRKGADWNILSWNSDGWIDDSLSLALCMEKAFQPPASLIGPAAGRS
jgi:hypothetical protein